MYETSSFLFADYTVLSSRPLSARTILTGEVFNVELFSLFLISSMWDFIRLSCNVNYFLWPSKKSLQPNLKNKGLFIDVPSTDSQSLYGPMQESIKTRVRSGNWTEIMDSAMLNVMIEEHTLGNFVNGSFTPLAWIRMIRDFNEKTKLGFNKVHLQNRLKVLKRQYLMYHTLANKSGWGWDCTQNIPTAGDSSDWNAIIAVDPCFFNLYNCYSASLLLLNFLFAGLCLPLMSTRVDWYEWYKFASLPEHLFQFPIYMLAMLLLTVGLYHSFGILFLYNLICFHSWPGVKGNIVLLKWEITWFKLSMYKLASSQVVIQTHQHVINLQLSSNLYLLGSIAITRDEEEDYWEEVHALLIEEGDFSFHNTIYRQPRRTRPFTGHELIHDILRGHPDRGYQYFRMTTTMFTRLREEQVGRGFIQNTRHLTADEQLGIFLFGTGTKGTDKYFNMQMDSLPMDDTLDESSTPVGLDESGEETPFAL
uniref:Uncharacterized protein n=1 Tax=Ananas comosus var. bracteatus TaxID=296719 RepID=A0A6V7NX75_ANACO|nr:unnamed protein product [Ananas comosus var. bracteatus]